MMLNRKCILPFLRWTSMMLMCNVFPKLYFNILISFFVFIVMFSSLSLFHRFKHLRLLCILYSLFFILQYCKLFSFFIYQKISFRSEFVVMVWWFVCVLKYVCVQLLIIKETILKKTYFCWRTLNWNFIGLYCLKLKICLRFTF